MMGIDLKKIFWYMEKEIAGKFKYLQLLYPSQIINISIVYQLRRQNKES